MKTAGWAAVLVVAIATVIYFASGLAEKTPKTSDTDHSELVIEQSIPDNLRPVLPAAQAKSNPSASELSQKVERMDESRLQEVIGQINEAATHYDPTGLPLIKPYLVHGNAEIREAAVDGLVTLGESGGAALLREASKQLTDSKEMIRYLEAAEYLELPSVTMTELEQEMAAKAGQIPSRTKAAKQVSPPLDAARNPSE